jgi:hypothetical protein
MIRDFSSHFIRAWNEASVELPASQKNYSDFEKSSKENSMNLFLQSVKQIRKKRKLKLEITTEDEERFFTDTRLFFKNALDFDESQVSFLFSEEMINVTRAFVYEARKFDSSLPFSDIFQALRNAWIMFGVQIIFGQSVAMTPSVFAYSMLYPYTDNLIDDPSISEIEKIAFSCRFRDRLSGIMVQPLSKTESTIYALVEMIEMEFSRDKNPEVFESLLAIHDAQTASLLLIDAQNTVSEEDSLSICIRKGGTSVLADGYLVTGKLSEEQQFFLYGYGAYLQMLDDIQDVEDDLSSGLKTYFARDIESCLLDWKVRKTYQFGEFVLESLDAAGEKFVDLFKALIRRSIDLFVAEAIAQNPEIYSHEFTELFEKRSPFSFSYIRNLNSRFSAYHGFLVTAAKEIALPRLMDVSA